jgi:AbiU2
MSTPSVGEVVAHIEAYAHAMTQGLRVMDERRHILAPLVQSDSVRNALKEKLDGRHGAHAYNHLAPLLAQDLIRELSRLLLDNDTRAASFVNLFRKASVPEVQLALREKFRSLPDTWNRQPGPIPGLTEELSEQVRTEWLDRDREEFAQSFDEGWAAAASAIAALAADPIAEKIKTFRNKHHAHLEMSPLGKDPGQFDVSQIGLTFNDLFAFADRYMAAAFELTRVLTGHVYNLDDFSEIHREQADDMWNVLAGLSDKNA